MDRVAKPTHYEPPRVRTYPQGTQGRVLVHYSATTIVYYPCTFFSSLQSDMLRAFKTFGASRPSLGFEPPS